MNELPEVYYIHSKNLEEKKIVADWFNNKYQKNRFKHTIDGEYYTPSINSNNLYGENKKPMNIPIITFEQFEMYVLNSKPKPVIVEDYKYLTSILTKYNIT
jgi:hypothetical protein